MKYGVRDIVDVVLRAKGTIDLGNKRFYRNEPVLYFDTLTTSTLEGAVTTVYAQGGKGNARLMSWDGERTVTFTMEDALISPESLAILTGAGLIEASDDAPIYQHMVETLDFNAADIEVTGENAVLKLKVSKEPYLPSPEEGIVDDNYAFVFFTRDGEVISEPYAVSQRKADVPKKGDDGMYEIIVNQHDCNLGVSCHEPNSVYYPYDMVTDGGRANGVLIDYYTPVRRGAKQIEIDAEKFAGSYYLEGSTLWKDKAGIEHPAEFIIPNCKIQSNFTFTMAASGDPSTFTFTMDAFPDYTRFDKSHKVFSAIQVIEEETTASDANNGLHRGATWSRKGYADQAASDATSDDHDNRD